MNFIEAVRAMKEGERVKREAWGENCIKYIYLDHNLMMTSDHTERSFYTDDYDATDWGIVKEYKPLSDKMHSIECGQGGFKFDGERGLGMRHFIRWIDSDDVKAALKDFLFWFDFKEWIESKPTQERIIQKAKEIFGDALLEA